MTICYQKCFERPKLSEVWSIEGKHSRSWGPFNGISMDVAGRKTDWEDEVVWGNWRRSGKGQTEEAWL